MIKTGLETAALSKGGTLVAVTRDFLKSCHALSGDDLNAIKAFSETNGIESVSVAGKVVIFKGYGSVCEGGDPQVALVWREEQSDHDDQYLYTATMDFPWVEGQVLFRDLSDHLKRAGLHLVPFVDRPMGSYMGKTVPGEPAVEERYLVVVPIDIVPDQDEGVLLTKTSEGLAIYTI